MPKKTNETILPSIKPNAVLEARFRKRLNALIEEMNKSVIYWIAAQWRKDTPVLAEDAKRRTPADKLAEQMEELAEKWKARFDEAAEELSEYYAQGIADRSDKQLRAALRKSGFSVEFKPTKAQKDIISATVHESAALIKSIPDKYLTDATGDIMRSVQKGGDLAGLSKKLQENYGVTKRRAHTIARDQNNKATAALNRGRQIELGITEAIWRHSHAGKSPRPTHVKMNGKRYNVDEGMWDSAVGEYVLPGQLINCRCTSRSVIKGFI